MIQFNLLPDIKVEYIRTQRLKRLVLLAALSITGLSVALLLILFSYKTVQQRSIAQASKKIDEIRKELEGNEDLTKILSVQNQLQSLPALYDGRPAITRLPDYLALTTPANVSISELTIDFSTGTMEINGTAQDIAAVNTYVDTLKFTKFVEQIENGQSDPEPAFSDVVLNQFSRGDLPGETAYSITLSFNPMIFDAAKTINLNVPKTVTTHASVQSQDSSLFNGAPPDAQEGDE